MPKVTVTAISIMLNAQTHVLFSIPKLLFKSKKKHIGLLLYVEMNCRSVAI
jgi:hypothetical protein